MTNEPSASSIHTLREWLRNERRLGNPIVGVSDAALARDAAASAILAPSLTTPPRAAPPVEANRARAAPVAPRAQPPADIPRPVQLDDSGLPAPCSRDLPPDEARRQLAVIDEQFVRGCTRCRLHSGRSRTVFGVGHPRPEIVFVGEGPGADEDRQGEPFVGRAGQLLTRMIAAMTLTRDQVYIANIVKCRPPENRTPEEDEMAACSPYLFRQLAILRPKVIVALGRPSSQTLLATTTPIGKLRGQFYDFPPPPLAHLGLPPARLMPTFHPSYLLRSPWEKGKAWADLQQVMTFLGIPIPARGGPA